MSKPPAPNLSDLPMPCAQFVQGANSGDLSLLLSVFVEDAIVNDQLCEHLGADEIRQWATQDVIERELRIDVVEMRTHYGQAILTAQIDGDFDKRGLPNPLLMAFYFTQDQGKVVQLIILPKTERRA
jgi:hypothetical protein